MRKLLHQNYFIAIALTGILFIIILLLFNPAYNTDVDINFLYTLSGGYGNEPSVLLHYSYGAHPLLSWIVAGLFRAIPGFNWYSFLLVLFHFACCVTLLISFLRSFRRVYAIIAFMIFFLFIESRLLLGFNYSGAALIGAVSGSFSLLLYLAEKKQGEKIYSKRVLFFSLLILTGGLIRIHYIALFGVVAIWIGLFILPRKQLIGYLKIQFILGLLLVIFFQGQRYYYENKIPQWREEEKIRQAYIDISIHPRKEPLLQDSGLEKLKQDMIRSSFLYDKNLVNYDAVIQFRKNNTRNLAMIPGSFQSFYWLFMDLRVYLLLFGGVLLFFLLNRNFKIVTRLIYMSLFPVLVFVMICLFFKITEVILMTALASVLLSVIFCSAGVAAKKPSIVAGSLLVFLSCGWMITRVVKKNDQNKKDISNARMLVNELNSHRDVLFVNGANPDLYLSIWDLPIKYPILNLIYRERFITNSYHLQLQRFGITDLMKEIPVKDNIYLVGEKSSILVEYYKFLYNQTVQVKKIPGFQYIDAYRVTADTTQ
jgi:MFS family permease